MMFARNPNGGIAAVPNQKQARQQARQGHQLPPQAQADDGSTAHLRARINALEAQNAGLNARLSKLEQAFTVLVRKLAVKSLPAAQQAQAQGGARVPEVVEFGGAAQRGGHGRSFDQDIEDAIAMSGGDDEEIPFGG